MPMKIKEPIEFHPYTMKIRSLIQTRIFKCIPKLTKSIARARSALLYILCGMKIICKRPSLHVLPITEPRGYTYYDATWRSVVPMEQCDDAEGEELGEYLQWLEDEEEESKKMEEVNEEEIDRLAERFIQKCHEKFMLEKQESYRRFQEMLIRSI